MQRDSWTEHRSEGLPGRAAAGCTLAPPASVSVDPLLRFEYAMRLKRIFPRGGRLLALGPVGPDLQMLLEDTEGPRISSQPDVGVPFDGAASGFAEATASDLERSASGLQDRLAPRAPIVAAVAGRRRRGGPLAAAGEADVRRILGETVVWRRRLGLGVLMPAGPVLWPSRFPQVFALLAMADRLVRGWPGLGSRGSCIVLEGSLRDSR